MKIGLTLLGFFPVMITNLAVMVASPSLAANLSGNIIGRIEGSDTEMNLGLHFIEAPEELILDGRNLLDTGSRPRRPIENPDPTRDIFTLVEKQSVTLSEDVYVWERFFRRETQSQPNVVIPANTVVNSYLFYFNPPGTQVYTWKGQIEFAEEILGIIAPEATEVDTMGTNPSNSPLVYWEQTNSLLGLENTEYSIRTWLDWYEDTVTYEGNLLSLEVASQRGYEPFRVITKSSAVPEPLTLLGVATATGFGAFFRRKLKNN